MVIDLINCYPLGHPFSMYIIYMYKRYTHMYGTNMITNVITPMHGYRDTTNCYDCMVTLATHGLLNSRPMMPY